MMKKMISYPPFYFFSIITLNFLCFILFPEFNTIPFPYNLIGIIAAAWGFYLLSRCSNTFHKNKTTFYLEEPTAFVQDGFYKVSRNPMYLGALMIICGQSVFLGNLISLLSPVLFFLCMNCLCIPPEEALMEKTFGSSYVGYKQKVRRWL